MASHDNTSVFTMNTNTCRMLTGYLFLSRSAGESAADDVCVGSLPGPGGAQPLRCLETAGHLRLQHRADPLRGAPIPQENRREWVGGRVGLEGRWRHSPRETHIHWHTQWALSACSQQITSRNVVPQLQAAPTGDSGPDQWRLKGAASVEVTSVSPPPSKLTSPPPGEANIMSCCERGRQTTEISHSTQAVALTEVFLLIQFLWFQSLYFSSVGN